MSDRRVFIAIDISDEARAAVAQYIQRLRLDFPRIDVGWEKPEKLHFTLKFLGNLGEDQLARVCEIVYTEAVEFAPFEVRIAQTGVFPHPKNPKVLWLDPAEGRGEIVKLKIEIESRLQEVGFEAEKRPFHPHLTIGRIRDPLKSRELVRTHKQRQLEPIVFTATDVTIYESKLQKAGSVYSVIRLFPFR